MKHLYAVLLLCGAAFSQCPQYYVDMLQYFVMQHSGYHMAPGSPHSNDIYSVMGGGIFFWVKSPEGWPWDVKSFDGSFIYDRATELDWINPSDYKRFVRDVPLSPRCIRWGQPGPVIRTPGPNWFNFFLGCRWNHKEPLGGVQTQITNFYWYQGGNIGVKARDLIYDYSCDNNWRNCTFREIFSLGLGLGLVHWKYYANGNLIDETVMDEYEPGQVQPFTPCPNLYK